jgi:large subunit ribosomal protein L7/L12
MADLAKLVDDLSALTVLEASELSKMLEEKWGVSAAAPVAVAAAPAAAAAPAEEKTEFDVILASFGENKINVIKDVRAIPGLGLGEAKALATMPSLDQLRAMLAGLLKQPATRIASVLQAPGGQIARVLSAYSEQGNA